MVFERMYGPLGGQREDYLAAMISSAIVSSLSEKAPPFADFIPDWEEAAHGDGT